MKRLLCALLVLIMLLSLGCGAFAADEPLGTEAQATAEETAPASAENSPSESPQAEDAGAASPAASDAEEPQAEAADAAADQITPAEEPAEEEPAADAETPAEEPADAETPAEEEPTPSEQPAASVTDDTIRASGTCGDNLTWELSADGVLTVSGTGAMYNYSEEDSSPWYSLRDGIETLVIEDGVAGIGSYAFSDCTGLTQITVGSGVTEIGMYAFRDCTGLRSVYIPAAVTAIRSYRDSSSCRGPFDGCSSLSAVYCEAAQAQSGWDTRWNYNGSSTVTVYCGISREDYGFWSTLDKSAESIVIPDTVTAIPAKAFENCKGLTDITIGSGVETIGRSAFSGCTGLTAVTVGSGVTDIDYYAFGDCTRLTSVYIPAGVTSVDRGIFDGCSASLVIYCEAAQAQSGWDSDWNSDGSGALTVYYGISPENYTYWSAPDTGAESIVIPDYITCIPEYAFKNRTGLTSVFIPAGVTAIGCGAFEGCDSSTVIYCEAAQAQSGWDNSWNYCTDADRLTTSYGVGRDDYTYWSTLDTGAESIVIPDTVTVIPCAAFKDCTGLTDITVGSGVTSIGSYAFCGCTGLTCVTVPDNVESIGEYAFSGCTALASVTISDSIGSIADTAFQYCSAVTQLNISAARVKEIGCKSGSCGDNLRWILVGGILKITGEGDMYDKDDSGYLTCKDSIYAVLLPDGLTSVGSYAFNGCTGLTCVDIPDSVTVIGSSAFSGCTGLTRIHIGSGVTEIGMYAFWYCSGLSSVYIPAATTVIRSRHTSAYDYGPFYGCDSSMIIHCEAAQASDGWDYNWNYNGSLLLTVYYGSSTENEEYMYWMTLDKSAESIVIPDYITSIPDYAFKDCTNLVDITIGSGVTEIGQRAFENCTGLTAVYIPATVTTIHCGTVSQNSYSTRYYGPFEGCSTSLIIYCQADQAPDGWDRKWNYYNEKYYLAAYYGISRAEYTYWTTMDNSGESIVLPDYVTTIPHGAFKDCTALTDITIPDNITTIGGRAFEGCTGLTSVFIPASVTNILGLAFYNCDPSLSIFCEAASAPYTWNYYWNYLTTNYYVNEPYHYRLTTSYGISRDNYTFWSTLDTGAESIVIPDNITVMPDAAFKNCTNLKNVVIGSGITAISSYAFYGCTALTSITVPDSVTGIGEYAFSGCTALTSFTAPGGAAAIGEYAFSGCTALTSITVPDSAAGTISDTAFQGCCAVTQLNISNDHAVEIGCKNGSCGDDLRWILVGGILKITGEGEMYSKENLSYLSYKSKIYTVLLPDDLTAIGSYAFQGCSKLTAINIPDSVTTIGKYAFAYCKGLTAINIPDSVTTIGEYAFQGCTALTGITVPDSVTTIGGSAFKDCTALTGVIIGSGVTKMDSSAFSGCTGLTDVTIRSGAACIGTGAFRDCTALTAISIPDSVTKIGESAFSGCTSLSSLRLPDSITNIPSSALYGCTALSVIVLPGSLTALHQNTFSHCTALKTVVFAGSAPTFESACMDENTVTCYYPAQDDTWTADVMKNYGGNITWVSYRTGTEIVLSTADCTTAGQSFYSDSAGHAPTLVITPALGHDYTDTIITAATCTQDGLCSRICNRCGFSCTETIPAGHTPVIDPAVAATETTTGLTEGSHCGVCGEVLVPQQVVPMKTAGAKGDISGDGNINVIDALRLFRAVNGQIDALSAEEADLNGDGRVNVIDALRLFRFVNGQIDAL